MLQAETIRQEKKSNKRPRKSREELLVNKLPLLAEDDIDTLAMYMVAQLTCCPTY